MSDAIFDHGVTPHKSKVLKGLNFNLRCHAGPVIGCIVSVTEGSSLIEWKLKLDISKETNSELHVLNRLVLMKKDK